MILPDYSEYLKQPGMLEFIEREWKANPHIHDDHARVVNEFIERKNISFMIEVGCGTGCLANRLVVNNYFGIDINRDCIEYARIKNPGKTFSVNDIRNVDDAEQLVISFGVLKHFGLHEWSTIFNKIASFGEYFIFNIPIAYETKDDGLLTGMGFHHVWKSKQDIVNDIEAAGLELLEIVHPSEVEPIFICKQKPAII